MTINRASTRAMQSYHERKKRVLTTEQIGAFKASLESGDSLYLAASRSGIGQRLFWRIRHTEPIRSIYFNHLIRNGHARYIRKWLEQEAIDIEINTPSKI